MAKVARSRRSAQVARSVPSRTTKAATERALAIATILRERGGWALTSANVYQGWTLELDGARYRVESLASAFLEGPRPPGFVFSLTIRAPRGTRAIRDRVVSTPWFDALRARVGQFYASDVDRAASVSLVRVMRGTTGSSTILDELRHIAAAVEGRPAVPRLAHERPPGAKALKEHRDDVWRLIDALGPTGWRISSIAQVMQRQLQRDGRRWHVAMCFSALVNSAENRPGFVGMVGSWSRHGESASRGNPISKASALLRKNGYRGDETHYQRWHRSLGPRAVNLEIELLERAMRLIVAASTA